MRIRDITRLSWDQVKRRKVVTALCAAGISIGCAAIVVALSVGESAQTYIEQEMNSFFKMDEITVTENGGVSSPGSQETADEQSLERGKLTDQKLEIIRNIPHVKAAAPFQQLNSFQMQTVDNRNSYIEIIGTDLNLLPEFDKPLMQGAPSDLQGTVILSYGATLGLVDEAARQSVLEQMQKNPYDSKLTDQYNKLNQTPSSLYQRQVQFRNLQEPEKTTVSSPFRVAGILKKASGVSEESASYDKKAYISLDTAQMLMQELYPGQSQLAQANVYNSILVKVDDQAYTEQVEKQIQKLTLSTQTNLQQKERIAQQFSIIKGVALGGGVFILIIASISIVVAMTMSTYQRRRQIGIMKVLGANLGQIRNMFIVEAALLGFLGGLLGVLFSYWIVWGINGIINAVAPEQEQVIIFIPLTTIPIGMLFAIMTGVLSGIYPAISASRTDALTAIRRD
ncbi:ABC transporter permease [Paenibacillus sepulcri]|uniref:FtsX-like permease family protein n=1 Tax=Paenibacillus sepulcri TaxID=359917 RepID=A0ABS7BWF3_9BACL|nr:FtsX-like permease family protein [Paenibacillus sepulcri]